MANEPYVKILKVEDVILEGTRRYTLRFKLSCSPEQIWLNNFEKASPLHELPVPFDKYRIYGPNAEISNVKESDFDEAIRFLQSFINQANEKHTKELEEIDKRNIEEAKERKVQEEHKKKMMEKTEEILDKYKPREQ